MNPWYSHGTVIVHCTLGTAMVQIFLCTPFFTKCFDLDSKDLFCINLLREHNLAKGTLAQNLINNNNVNNYEYINQNNNHNNENDDKNNDNNNDINNNDDNNNNNENNDNNNHNLKESDRQ